MLLLDVRHDVSVASSSRQGNPRPGVDTLPLATGARAAPSHDINQRGNSSGCTVPSSKAWRCACASGTPAAALFVSSPHDSILCNVKADMTVHRLSGDSLGDSTRPAPVINRPKDLDVAS